MKRERKGLRDLNLLDRFLFAETIEDPEAMELILEIILGRDVVLKHLPQAEKEHRRFLWGKQVKLDVWAEDTDDILYDVEVQKRNTKDIPKRSRMYNSMIDSRLLLPGTRSYNELNDVYIIIITPFDLFGKGRYKYTFGMGCVEHPGIWLNDGATRIFLNTGGTDSEGVSEELVALLRYFESSTDIMAKASHSEKINNLHKKVVQIKENEKVGIKFMNLWEEKLLDRQEGYEKGLAEGEKRGRVVGITEGESKRSKEIAEKMKEKGIALAEISDMTGIPVSDLEKL